jgi:hypothetical protein
MDASPTHIACASAGGELRIYSTTTLEEVASLACPGAPANPALRPAAVSCVFNPDGTRLTALFSDGQLCSWGFSNSAEVCCMPAGHSRCIRGASHGLQEPAVLCVVGQACASLAL